jgi:hypothetical protein
MSNIITLCSCCHLQGVHERRLLIEIVEVLEDDLIVKFTRLRGWKPA